MESKYTVAQFKKGYHVMCRESSYAIMSFYDDPAYDAKTLAEKFCKMLNEGELSE